MARLIAIDIDGTLIRRDQTVPDQVLEYIKKARGYGYLITLVSGRSEPWMVHILNLIGIDLPHISSGGAVIANHLTNETYWSNAFDEETTKSIIRMAYGMKVIGVSLQNRTEVVSDGGFFSGKDIERFPPIRITPSLLDDNFGDVFKIDISGDPKMLAVLNERINKEIIPTFSTGIKEGYLQLNKSGVNKGSSLIKLGEMLDIDMKDVAAIGDGDNDIPMFEVAGTSFVMNQADEETKEAATHIIPPLGADSLLWAFDKIFALDGVKISDVLNKK